MPANTDRIHEVYRAARCLDQCRSPQNRLHGLRFSELIYLDQALRGSEFDSVSNEIGQYAQDLTVVTLKLKRLVHSSHVEVNGFGYASGRNVSTTSSMT